MKKGGTTVTPQRSPFMGKTGRDSSSFIEEKALRKPKGHRLWGLKVRDRGLTSGKSGSSAGKGHHLWGKQEAEKPTGAPSSKGHRLWGKAGQIPVFGGVTPPCGVKGHLLWGNRIFPSRRF